MSTQRNNILTEVDEICLLILPLADGMTNTPTTFEVSDNGAWKWAQELKLVDARRSSMAMWSG